MGRAARHAACATRPGSPAQPRQRPRGGSIEGALAQTDGAWAEVSVRDHGLGIAPDRRGTRFERFTQGQGHVGGYRSGMGLGLWVCRQIVRRHGGRLRAEFPPDGGTRFVVYLPRTARAVGVAAP